MVKTKELLKQKAEKRIEEQNAKRLHQTMLEIEQEEQSAKQEAQRKKQREEDEKKMAIEKAYTDEQRSLNTALSQVQQICSYLSGKDDKQKAYMSARNKFLKTCKSAGINTPMLNTLTI
tara:strand:- start:514 stop:870 length:357 start_codon:yes stop_codon:yes gene_type:complete